MIEVYDCLLHLNDFAINSIIDKIDFEMASNGSIVHTNQFFAK